MIVSLSLENGLNNDILIIGNFKTTCFLGGFVDYTICVLLNSWFLIFPYSDKEGRFFDFGV